MMESVATTPVAQVTVTCVAVTAETYPYVVVGLLEESNSAIAVPTLTPLFNGLPLTL